jgi:nucleotide-binding universal stress UspA family protein
VHVLIATDGSRRSIDAARRASELLHTADKVTLLTVVTEVPGDDAGGFAGSVYSPDEIDAVWNQELAEAGEELSRTAQALTHAKIDKRIEVGAVANTVCRLAGELEVDVIVAGSHGHTGLGRLFLGSVSEHIVRHAPCPVLIVRNKDDAPKEKDAKSGG